MEAKLAELQLRIEKLENEKEGFLTMIEKHERILQGFGIVIGGKKMKNGKAKKEKPVCLPAKDDVIRFGSTSDKDFGYLSLYYKAPFSLDGFEWPSIMHYMSGAKFLTSDPEYAEAIRTTENSAMAKSKGKSKAHKIDDDWDELVGLKRALQAKFEQNEKLAEKLIETDMEKSFEFEAPKDTIYGIGVDGKGHNHFGKFLTEIRAELCELVEEDE
jgi:ribA/ribD-fused uncharacterized protein